MFFSERDKKRFLVLTDFEKKISFGLKEVITYLENHTETGDGDSAGNEGYLSTATTSFYFSMK